MATIKGQKLRLFLDGQVIAAAQSCTVHIAVNMADCSSKDDTDNWQRQEPVGLSWDASVDALVCVNAEGASTQVDTNGTIKVKNVDYCYYKTPVSVAPGACIKVKGEVGDAVIINSAKTDVLSSGTTAEWVNNGRTAAQVYVGTDADEDTVTYIINTPITTLEHFEHLIAQAEVLDIQFAEAGGSGNGTVGTWKGYQGKALITDVSVNSQNRGLSTYSIKLTGTWLDRATS